MSDYKIEHWTAGQTVPLDDNDGSSVSISVNNRAATRQAIITALGKNGHKLIERSSWHAQPPRESMRESHWDYRDIVIHHAGRSYSCGASSIAEMQRVQTEDMGRNPAFDDVGYHYAVSCQGDIYEGRDIRFIGEHVASDNSGKVGIVFLSDLVQMGEAYEQEYGELSFLDKIKNIRGIVTDRMVVKHDRPTTPQIKAAGALCKVLKEFFNIKRLGGHREYQMLATNKGRACPGHLGMEVVKSLRMELGLSGPGK
jgi:hypothetical protein